MFAGELSRFVQAAVADDGSAVFVLVDRKNMRLKVNTNFIGYIQESKHLNMKKKFPV